MAAAYVPPEVAHEVWGPPDSVLAWGPGKGAATPDTGGYRLSGQWSFASGGRNATWLGGVAVLKDRDGNAMLSDEGQPIARTFLVPATEAKMTEVWDVIGLLGTGSDAYAVDNLHVPSAFSFERDDPSARLYDQPLYLFPIASLYAIGFSAVALGIARTMLDDFMKLASTKKPRLARQKLGDNSAIHAQLAQAEAELGAARAFLFGEVSEVWAATCDAGELAIGDRMRIRLATTYGIHAARRVGSLAYELAGASAIFASSPLQRRFRDLHTVTQQIQGRRDHFETVGAFLLGLPADLSLA
jgi:alkylation response protein AidB-like acyl-CoA dehydrogenase